MGINTGNGTRIGIVGGRSQVYNPKTDCYVKRDKETGQFIGCRKEEPFKAIRKEKQSEEKKAKK